MTTDFRIRLIEIRDKAKALADDMGKHAEHAKPCQRVIDGAAELSEALSFFAPANGVKPEVEMGRNPNADVPVAFPKGRWS